MGIDWSKAPEGATHWDPVDQNWLRQLDEVALNWLTGKGWSKKGWQYPDDLSTMPRLIARPAWTGSGLPPVGTVCEMRRTDYVDVDWQEIAFLCAGDKKAFFRDRDGHEWSRPLADLKFRPIRTPEQIAAEVEAKAVSDMRLGLPEWVNKGPLGDIETVCMMLYRAGYRKQVQP